MLSALAASFFTALAMIGLHRLQGIDPKAIVDLGSLTGTSGMQDYKFPAAMAANAMTYHTVVLWDTQMTHAVAAAPLAGG